MTGIRTAIPVNQPARGNFSIDEWNADLKQDEEAWHENTADYLFRHPLLVDFLTEGLDLFGYRCD